MAMDWSLTPVQADIEGRLRTGSQLICAAGVLGAILYYLRPVLVPLVLALALKHLLQPIIKLLSVRPLVCCGRVYLSRPIASCSAAHRRSRRLGSFCDAACKLQLPHSAAVVVSLFFVFALLALLAAIVADSVHVFAERADVYAKQVARLLGRALGWIEYFSCNWTPRGCPLAPNATNATMPNTTSPEDAAGEQIERLLSSVPITKLALNAAESLLDLLSNLFIIFLFTVYLLVGSKNHS